MRLNIDYIRSIPKSLYLSLKFYPFRKAIKLPILVCYNCRIISLKGKIIGGGKLRMGFDRVGLYDKKYSPPIIELNGILKITGVVSMGQGAKISVGKNGLLEIGNHFHNTAEGAIVCNKHIRIGENVLTSWNTLIMDTDFHQAIDIEDNRILDSEKEVIIENNAWICTRAVVLKGAVVGEGCIVGANALVSKAYHDKNLLIAGNPASIKKKNITLLRNS